MRKFNLFSASCVLAVLLELPLATPAVAKDERQELDILCTQVHVRLVDGTLEALRFQCKVDGNFQEEDGQPSILEVFPMR
jgi:hypothetical protein